MGENEVDIAVVEIDGKYNLKQINGIIEGEEKLTWEFKDSQVTASSTGTGAPYNSVTLSAVGTIPKPLTIVEQGAPQPPGTKQVWSGAMVVEGKTIAVVAYREV